MVIKSPNHFWLAQTDNTLMNQRLTKDFETISCMGGYPENRQQIHTLILTHPKWIFANFYFRLHPRICYRILTLCLVTLISLTSLLIHAQNDHDSIQFIKQQLSAATSDAAKAELLVSLADKLRYINPAEGVESARQAASLAKKLNDNELYLRALNLMAVNYTNLDHIDSVLVVLHEALQTEKISPHSKLRLKTNVLLGTAHNKRNRLDSARYYYEAARELALELDDKNSIAAIYANLGTVAESRGDLKTAFDNYLLGLKFYEEAGDLQRQAISLNNIGLLNNTLGNQNRAVDYILRAVEINQQINSFYHLSTNYGNLGMIYQYMDNYEEAENFYQKSYQIARDHGFALDEARALLNLGSLYMNLDRIDDARTMFTLSLEICKERGITYGVMLNYFNMVDIALIENDFEMANLYLDKTYEIASEIEQLDIVKKVYQQRATVNEATGNYAEALNFFKKFNHLDDSLTELANKTQIEEIQTRYETDKKELENQTLRLENDSKARIIKAQRYIFAAIAVILMLLIILIIYILRSRKKIQKINAELNELNSTKDKLFSVISHDLRSPFNSLLGFLQMLIEDYDSFDDKEKKEMLEMVYQQGNNTYSLLENLLQWSLAQRGRINYNPGMHDLHELAKMEVDFLESRAFKKNISIVNEIEPDRPIYADNDLVKIMLRNIINNSIKFTHMGGKILLSSSQTTHTVSIQIKDNGVGMSPGQVSQLIVPKAVRSTQGTAGETGSGLGLALVKEFADLNNATLKVESAVDAGTTITITFKKSKDSAKDL
jgi:signal transduction histidine kinase